MKPADGPALNPFRAAREAGALLSMGRPHAALALLARALREEPENPYLHRGMSKAFAQLDRFEDAISSAELAIAYKPDGWLMHTALALAYINAYRHHDAITPALAAVRLEPNASYPHAWAGEALRGAGQLDEALASARSATEIAPDRHRPLKARVLLSLERWRQSEQESERAYRHYPEDAYLVYFHGLALLAQGRKDEAASLQSGVLRRQPASLLSRLLLERIESLRPGDCPDNPAFVLGLEGELHRERIVVLRREVEQREPNGPYDPGSLPPPSTAR